VVLYIDFEAVVFVAALLLINTFTFLDDRKLWLVLLNGVGLALLSYPLLRSIWGWG
jgi:hypothetical protein